MKYELPEKNLLNSEIFKVSVLSRNFFQPQSLVMMPPFSNEKARTNKGKPVPGKQMKY